MCPQSISHPSLAGDRRHAGASTLLDEATRFLLHYSFFAIRRFATSFALSSHENTRAMCPVVPLEDPGVRSLSFSFLPGAGDPRSPGAQVFFLFSAGADRYHPAPKLRGYSLPASLGCLRQKLWPDPRFSRFFSPTVDTKRPVADRHRAASLLMDPELDRRAHSGFFSTRRDRGPNIFIFPCLDEDSHACTRLLL